MKQESSALEELSRQLFLESVDLHTEQVSHNETTISVRNMILKNLKNLMNTFFKSYQRNHKHVYYSIWYYLIYCNIYVSVPSNRAILFFRKERNI